MKFLLRGLSKGVLGHPKLTIGIWLTISAIAAAQLPNTQYSADNRVFFAASDRAFLGEMEAKYNHSNQVYVVLHTNVPASDFSNVRHDVLDMHEALWHVENVTRVDSVVNYKDLVGSGDELSSQNFVSPERLLAGQPTRAQLRAIQKDPVVRNRFLTEDLKTFAFLVTVSLPDQTKSNLVGRIVEDVKSVTNQIALRNTGYQIHISGTIPLMAAFGDAALADLQTLIPLALVVSALLVVGLLKSLRWTIGLLLASACSALITVGIWVALGHAFNTATSVAPIVVMTLCIAGGLHILIAIRRQSALAQPSKILRGLQQTLAPSLTALLTTLIGFLAFGGADAPPLQSMGFIVCSGLIIAYTCLYTLMPAVMMLLKLPDSHRRTRNTSFINSTNERKHTLWCGLLLLASLPGIYQISVDDNFSHYFDQRFDYRQAADFTQSRFTGQTVIHLDLPHPAELEVTDPNYLAHMDEFVRWARTRSVVTSVVSYLDPLRRVATSIPERSAALPTDELALAEYLLMYELSLSPGESMSDFIAIDRRSSRAIISLTDLSSAQIQHFEGEVEAYLAHQGYFRAVSIFGLGHLFAHLSENNIWSMIGTTVASLVLIALLVSLLFRGFTYGFACLIIGLLPLAVGFGMWGWIYQTLGLPGAVIVGVTIGVLIDDCVHFIHRYRMARSESSHTEAVRYAFDTAGSAMVITTIALICGFATLTASGFLINVQLGVFSCMVFALALVFCFGMLPWLLSLSGKQHKPQLGA